MRQKYLPNMATVFFGSGNDSEKLETMGSLVKKCSYTFSNGITVVNTTPHPLNFLSPEGEKIVIPTSVPEGEWTGRLVVNATAKETTVVPHVVDTLFQPNAEGETIVAEIKKVMSNDNLMIVGSMIAANAYPDIVGIRPAPGYERVSPANKL